MDSQLFDSFNLALKVAILANGLTQRELARRVRIDETRLSRIVRRQVVPFPSEKRVLAKALHRAEVELFPPPVEAKGWTRARMAKRVKISATTYGRIERGYHTQTSILQKIADEHGVQIAVVLGNSGVSSGAAGPPPTPAFGELHHVQGAGASAAEVRALRAHVNHLQDELAAITAQHEAWRRSRSGPALAESRSRKPRGPKPVAKTRA